MKFEIITRNFESSKEVTNKIAKSLGNLNRTLKSFTDLGKPASIIIEKIARTGEFIAKVNFHLPKHTVTAKDRGNSPEQAVQKASEDAREQVVKIKDLTKDIHEIRRRSHPG